MKQTFFLAIICFFVVLPLIAQRSTNAPNGYRLKKVIPLEGRQGIASDSNYYYNSSSTALYKYDKNGKLIAQNLTPFTGFQKAVNHFGDIDVYRGEIFTGVEFFEDGVGKDIQIAVYDTDSLKLKYVIPIDSVSGQVEVSALTIDPERGKVWMTDWVNGNYIYRYDLATRKYEGKLHLRPVPQYQQGIFYGDGKLLISADDGDADFHETDNIYIIDVSDLSKTDAYVNLYKECKEFIRAGEIEGLSIDPKTDELLVLMNRGSRIVLGMVKGFYDGYDKEIHELYIYEKVNSPK